MFKNKNFRTWIAVSVFLSALVLVVGLISVSYAASSALLSGIILALVAKNYFSGLAKYAQLVRRLLRNWLKLLLLGLLVLFLFSTLLHQHRSMRLLLPIVKSYQITIEPVNNKLREFKLEEEVKLNERQLFSLLENKSEDKSDLDKKLSTLSKKQLNRQISSTNRGLIVKEVCVAPLNLDSTGYISLKLVNGVSLREKLCQDICPDSSIELVDFPTGSFYQAKGADDLKISPYLDTETVSWSVPNLRRGIRLAYIPPPYHYFRRVIKPFLEFASVNKWIIMVLGGMLTVIFTSILKPVINVKAIATAESKSVSEASKYDMRGANFQGGFAETNYGKMVEDQYNYLPEQRQTLVEAAEEIQQLLKQLEKTTPTATEAEKKAFVTAAILPTRRKRFVNALEAGGKEALKEFLDNPYLNVGIAILEGWKEVE